MINRILIILALLLALIPARAQFQSVTTTANGTLHSPTNFWAQNSLAIANALIANPDALVVRIAEEGDGIGAGVWITNDAEDANFITGNFIANIIHSGPDTLTVRSSNDSVIAQVSPGEIVQFSITGATGSVASRFTPAPLPTTNGIIARTGDGQTAARRLVAPAEGIAITNPDGVSGNITLSLTGDLSGLEGLTGTGLAARTGNGTWATRQLLGTTGEVTVTGNVTTGNLTLDLPDTLNGNRNIGDSTASVIRLAGTSSATAGLTVESGQLRSGMNSALLSNQTVSETVMTQKNSDERYAFGFQLSVEVAVGSPGEFKEFAQFSGSLPSSRQFRIQVLNFAARTQAFYDVMWVSNTSTEGVWENIPPLQIGNVFFNNARFGLQIRRDGDIVKLRMQRLSGTELHQFSIRILGARHSEFTILNTGGSDAVATGWFQPTSLNSGGAGSGGGGIWIPPGSASIPSVRFLNADASDLSPVRGLYGLPTAVGVAGGFLMGNKTVSSGTTINLTIQNNVLLSHSSNTTITGFTNGLSNQQTNLVNVGNATITIQNNADVVVRGGANLVLPPGAGCTVFHRSATTFSVW